MINYESEPCSTISAYGQSNFSSTAMCAKYLEAYDSISSNTRKQRVLLIDVNCKNSSTGKIVYDLYQNIRADGREAAICYGRGEKIVEQSIYKFGIDWETYIHALLSRVTGYNGCFSPISTKRLIKFIDQFKPDIIHIHELHSYFVNIKPLINYIKRHNIPLIWTFHCEYMYTGKCGHAGECNNFMYKCGNCPKVREYPKSLFIDKTRQMLASKRTLLEDLDFKIITPSQWLADRVKRSFLRDKPMEVIHNGIDTNLFHPRADYDVRQKYIIDKNAIMLIAVGNDILSANKGGRYLIDLSRQGKLKNTEIILIGASKSDINEYAKKSNSYKKDSQLIIEDRDHSNKIHLIPLIRDQIELACFYTSANILVLTSKKETYSLPCAEALCCGTPVVGFECGAPETIFKRPQARFVQYDDLTALTMVINEVISEKNEEMQK